MGWVSTLGITVGSEDHKGRNSSWGSLLSVRGLFEKWGFCEPDGPLKIVYGNSQDGHRAEEGCAQRDRGEWTQCMREADAGDEVVDKGWGTKRRAPSHLKFRSGL